MNAMTIEQISVFAPSLLFGITAGGLYGILRVFRRRVRHPDAWILAEDFLYIFACFGALLWIAHSWNYGRIRLYMITGILIGFLLYHVLLSRICSFVTDHIMMVFLFLNRIIWQTFLWPGKKFMKSFVKILKNIIRTVRIINSRL